jgi:uncharacterized protein (DUF934 family)
MQFIRDRRIGENRWQHVPEGALALDANTRLPDAVIVTLADWRLHKHELLRRGVRVGVRIDAGDDVDGIVEDLSVIGVVALEFDSFTEGRPYTHARLLRERYGYRGEIRAVGDVSRDRLAFMERCGINAYELREDCDPQEAIEAFGEISDVYQPAADQRRVIASRRA